MFYVKSFGSGGGLCLVEEGRTGSRRKGQEGGVVVVQDWQIAASLGELLAVRVP